MTHKILVVEDDKKIALALAVRLRAAGYDVIAAPDAVLAMSMALKHRPDLLVLDLLIPGGNGFQVAEWLQDLEAMIVSPQSTARACCVSHPAMTPVRYGILGMVAPASFDQRVQHGGACGPGSQ